MTTVRSSHNVKEIEKRLSGTQDLLRPCFGLQALIILIAEALSLHSGVLGPSGGNPSSVSIKRRH